MKTNGNDSVSPIDLQKNFEAGLKKNLPTSCGLTKRELFAAMALQGLVSNPQYDATVEDDAKTSVRLADALIKELNETAGE